ncbi:MAG: DUF4158 domain-containing protein [Actinobacteria bacterium]|nr:DUF4158 domain-containing protein [Actinomycetota bacterium]
MTPPARDGAAARSSARSDIGLDDVVEHFTLDDLERELLRNKSGSTRLGFAAMLKFLGWKGRFPRGLFELPDDAIEHLARQVKVAAAQIGAYDFTGRQIKNHRREIRAHTGFRICTVRNAEQLAAWLASHIAQDERRVEHVRASLLAHCLDELIEPPTAERASRIVDSAIRQADAMLVATVVGRLNPGHIARIETLLNASVVETDVDSDPAERRVEPEDELSAVKASAWRRCLPRSTSSTRSATSAYRRACLTGSPRTSSPRGGRAPRSSRPATSPATTSRSAWSCSPRYCTCASARSPTRSWNS